MNICLAIDSLISNESILLPARLVGEQEVVNAKNSERGFLI